MFSIASGREHRQTPLAFSLGEGPEGDEVKPIKSALCLALLVQNVVLEGPWSLACPQRVEFSTDLLAQPRFSQRRRKLLQVRGRDNGANVLD